MAKIATGFFKSICIALIALAFCIPQITKAWFDPSPPDYGKVIITRANTYETYPTNINVFADSTSLAGVPFYDQGDVNSAITWQYGGDPNNTFFVAYPVTLYFWFQTNSILANHEYEIAKVQYFEGTDSGSSVDWITIATVTNFPPSMLNHQGAHFGFMTWTPPKTNNVDYLIRIWARLKNGMENASTNSINIDKDGNATDWDDYEVLLIKTDPTIKPGTRSTSLDAPASFVFVNDNGQTVETVTYSASTQKSTLWSRVKNFFKSMFQKSPKGK